MKRLRSCFDLFEMFFEVKNTSHKLCLSINIYAHNKPLTINAKHVKQYS